MGWQNSTDWKTITQADIDAASLSGILQVTFAVPDYPVASGNERGVEVLSEDQGEITGGTTVSITGEIITATIRSGFTMSVGERYRARYITSVKPV